MFLTHYELKIYYNVIDVLLLYDLNKYVTFFELKALF